MLRHLVNLFLWWLPPSRMFGLRRVCLRAAGIELGKGADICGRAWIYGRGAVRIGAETWVSPGGVIYSHLDAPVVIGARCDIGPDVRFVTGSHEIGGSSRRAGAGLAHPIRVGDGCWIGASSVLLGGVTIGPGSMIAAGSVVTRDVEENTLVGGVPAREIRRLPI